jgi:acetyl/propionyl-CoA carboxylase alpha subunit
MERLGQKRGARDLAESLGVPDGRGPRVDGDDDRELLRAARAVGFPLLVKASAGGGGKGMRLVERERDFLDALRAGRREAQAAFGDPTMLIERRVFPARHVEVQVFGDVHGKVVSVHERECSVQRRHQKVLEESPSPAVGEELRAAMGAAAVTLCEAVGYRSAGTVEFLLDESGAFFFLEVNTRLQVEHPVTELVTGLDLARLQILLAAGHSLDELLPDGAPQPRGWALEARICAESPEQGFLPAAGRLAVVVEADGPGVRVDSGVRSGSVVSVHYDSLLAKLIVHAPDRETACRRMARALADSTYLGIPTNVDFLRRVVEHEDFVAGRLRTDFLDLHPELTQRPAESPPDDAYVAAALCAVLAPAGAASVGAGAGAGRSDPFREVGPLRLWGGGA